MPGLEKELIFDEELIQGNLNNVTSLLDQLVEASVEFLQASG